VVDILNAETVNDMSSFGQTEGTARTSASEGAYARFIKPTLDKIIVILASPFILVLVGIVALMIRRDGGPAFYSQPRLGKDGKVFTCWKLRSMVVNADEALEEYLSTNPEARAEWDRDQKLKNDPRITRLGNFIRKASIDELPQLWCVLKGDMSLVGPRPFMLDQKDLYPRRIR